MNVCSWVWKSTIFLAFPRLSFSWAFKRIRKFFSSFSPRLTGPWPLMSQCSFRALCARLSRNDSPTEPRTTEPRKTEPRKTQPRMDWTSNGLNPDWIQPRMGLNPEWTEPQMGLNPEWTQPEWDSTPNGTELRMDSTPTGLNPDWDWTPTGLNPDWDSTPTGLNSEWDWIPTGTQPRISINLEYGVQWCISKECI
jgi:hypothetical protein